MTDIKSFAIGKYCIIRTFSAGVHCGTLVARDGREVLLAGARRIFQWLGANTLHEIALNGVGPGSKISEEVPEILVTEAIEVIPCSPHAIESLRGGSWG